MLKRKAAAYQMPRMQVKQLPAPTRGLNLRTGIASMKIDDALVLDNYFPETSYLSLRKGYTTHATGVGAAIKTMHEWAGPLGRQMFAARSTAIYSVTAQGAVGAAVLSSLNSGAWSSVNFTSPGGHFLVMANGVDAVRNYDGTTWTTPTITGVTSSQLSYVHSHKARQWFVQAGTTKAWYLDPNSIAGPATKFELGEQFLFGGSLVAIGSISRDGGTGGSDDLLAFVSSRGELVVYEGDDPSTINTWSRMGRYQAAPPIGKFCMASVGGDLALLTESGILSARQLLTGSRQSAERDAITGRIDRGLSDAFETYGSLEGWSLTIYPRGHMLIVNIPTSNSTASQYVMNTQTGAWCTFSGLNATAWCLLSENPYFGASDGTVYRADNGYYDNTTSPIVGEFKTAFRTHAGGGIMRVTNLRPLWTSSQRILFRARMDMDYDDNLPSSTDAFPASTSGGALWGSAVWDEDLWGVIGEPQSDWVNVDGIGNAASIHIVTSTSGVQAILNAFDLHYETARGMAL